jgi:quercetin dioxygenase-like cupin family protein
LDIEAIFSWPNFALYFIFMQAGEVGVLKMRVRGKIAMQSSAKGELEMSSSMKHKVERWTGDSPPSEADLRSLLNEQGLSGYRWANSPGDIYGAHSHPFHKIIYVVQGSISFILLEEDEQVALNAGDRLDLPMEMIHKAVVGQQGVICLEAHQ